MSAISNVGIHTIKEEKENDVNQMKLEDFVTHLFEDLRIQNEANTIHCFKNNHGDYEVRYFYNPTNSSEPARNIITYVGTNLGNHCNWYRFEGLDEQGNPASFDVEIPNHPSFHITKENIITKQPNPRGILGGATSKFKTAQNQDRTEMAHLVAHRQEKRASLYKAYQIMKDLEGSRGIPHAYALVEDHNKRNQFTLSLYLELFQAGDLFGCYEQVRSLPDAKKMALMEDLIEGLYAMHTKGIAHGDIKLENVLINRDFTNAVITDFDLSRRATEGNALATGTPAYLSPEKAYKANNGRSITFADELKADIWALGLVFCIMTQETIPPFLGLLNPMRTLVALSSQRCSWFAEPPVHNTVSHLIWEMCQCQPGRRPSIQEVRQRWDEIKENMGLKPSSA